TQACRKRAPDSRDKTVRNTFFRTCQMLRGPKQRTCSLLLENHTSSGAQKSVRIRANSTPGKDSVQVFWGSSKILFDSRSFRSTKLKFKFCLLVVTGRSRSGVIPHCHHPDKGLTGW